MTSTPPLRDHVDAIVGQWSQELPDLETTTMELFGRIYRLAESMGTRMSRAYEPCGLTRSDFDVLATLRRAGPPFRLAPTDLAASTMVTTGGMTGRLRKLEEAGLIERVPHPRDGRASYAQLTTSGVRTVERAVRDGADAQTGILDTLGEENIEELNTKLRELLAVVERLDRTR